MREELLGTRWQGHHPGHLSPGHADSVVCVPHLMEPGCHTVRRFRGTVRSPSSVLIIVCWTPEKLSL